MSDFPGIGASILIGCVAKANANDITGQVLISAKEDNTVMFLANNGKLAVTDFIKNANIKKIGDVCVSFYELFNFVNSFKPWNDNYETGVKEVVFKKIKSKKLSVSVKNCLDDKKCTNNVLKLKLFPPEKMFYPKAFGQPNFSISSDIFKKAISKVLYAINPNIPRIFIKGMHIKFNSDYIHFVGTDALKLSEFNVKNTSDLDEKSYLLPYDFTMSARKIMPSNSVVFFDIEENQIKLAVNTITLYGTLVKAESFPSYLSTFDSYTNSIVIDRNILLSSFIPYLSVLNDDDYKRITISINNNLLHVYSDFSSSKFEGVDNFDDSFIIDVNGLFLAQTLETFEDYLVKMSFSDEDGVLIFSTVDDESHRALITPIKRRA